MTPPPMSTWRSVAAQIRNLKRTLTGEEGVTFPVARSPRALGQIRRGREGVEGIVRNLLSERGKKGLVARVI